MAEFKMQDIEPFPVILYRRGGEQRGMVTRLSQVRCTVEVPEGSVIIHNKSGTDTGQDWMLSLESHVKVLRQVIEILIERREVRTTPH